MSREEIVRCDRCGKECTGDYFQNASISVQFAGGIGGRADVSKNFPDMCRKCYDSMVEHINVFLSRYSKDKAEEQSTS